MTAPHPLVAELAEARKAAGRSISDTARRAMLVPTTPWYWEERGTVPSLDAFIAYADALGFDVVLKRRELEVRP